MPAIDQVEGIGAVYGAKLKAAGVSTTEDLLDRGKDKSGRTELSAATGITEQTILEWVNRCDLMRISGIGSEYADLLEAAGVDSVPELGKRNAANLAVRLVDINARRALVRRVPVEAMIEEWVEQAQALPRVVVHS